MPEGVKWGETAGSSLRSTFPQSMIGALKGDGQGVDHRELLLRRWTFHTIPLLAYVTVFELPPALLRRNSRVVFPGCPKTNLSVTAKIHRDGQP